MFSSADRGPRLLADDISIGPECVPVAVEKNEELVVVVVVVGVTIATGVLVV